MIPLATDITSYLRDAATDPQFPDAPFDWTRADAERIARDEGLSLTADHWDVVRALHHYYARHQDLGPISLRDLHDALDEHFHAQGGLKFLYTLFPAGPIAQSCRLAGLKAPFIATDRGFGSAA
ncbi:MAG TPA: TusE/DsrC/DsvC family sulfur relay protein [Thiobacillus sp.]|nr:TusE/DsrC/DsvC family sulfur relay protein [Thiobacillus sp.]